MNASAMMRFLTKLRSLTAAEVRERLGQATARRFEVLGLSRAAREPNDQELWSLLDPSRVGSAVIDREGLLARFRLRADPSFFAGVRDGRSAAEIRTIRWDGARAALVAGAERIRAGRYDLLGHTDLSFAAPIDWHLDPTTGRQAPKRHWSRIPYLDVGVVGDHKVVWELNRHQHFVVLGRAYRVTGDSSYARCFTEQLGAWMDANPPKIGVNWASSLEVAYRAVSWIWALELFRDAPELDADLFAQAVKHLYVSGRHLERYLSTFFSPNTHLTGEGLGLLYLGTFLPELTRSRMWRARGREVLEQQLVQQVHEDGVYFEQASYYHRYTVDIYLHALLLARLGGEELRPKLRRRLELAVEHLADLTQPDGTIPLIGDDDGGRLIMLEERAAVDVRATLGLASVLLQRGDIGRVAGGATEEVLWLLGPEGMRAANIASNDPPPAHLSRLFPIGGYAVLRDSWEANANHSVIDCGPHGTMNCGHAHADALSITVVADGLPLLVDSGTYTYTGSAVDRDHYRHSAAHNTITVDGESSSVPAGPFSWRVRSDARVEDWFTGRVVDFFAGSHHGFERLRDPVRHLRRVLFVHHGYWVIHDTLFAAQAHDIVAHFHVAQGGTVIPQTESSAILRVQRGGRRTSVLLTALGDVASVSWDEDWLSPMYGARSRARIARVHAMAGAGRRDLLTVLTPVADGVPVSVTGATCEGGLTISIDRADVRDLLVFRLDGQARAHGTTTSADMTFVRRSQPNGPPDTVALFGASGRLELDVGVFQAQRAAEFQRQGQAWSIAGAGQVDPR